MHVYSFFMALAIAILTAKTLTFSSPKIPKI
ncbi:hypothetical protein cje33_06171 [Campylobacter jejuni subsp. jejuni 87330]|uniref:NADH dehydrogenase subunit 6 n=1 Tax=Campylobacter jejuni subsp. jejuni 2008-988 TaxID=889253 RepID=A0ABC9QNF7_CAMJU|nr:hypothetical protein N916_03385 [Campylobacter jejuni subsp. jejuni NCTC 11168-K12E5]AHK54527.1 hypothetical protein N919_03385 [Campylobacter jejuni subsp. jejuni NCTC 11168-Kf1]AHK59525.1 hypothetical protein N920_03400 [Campylobacter jejuni subsp. jejuni NCTC 11168-GSv]EIB18881.1 hypothetical protein cje102_06949 [Campylobacter jejuni subsp. jejuni LMG 23218]EIB47369.1 hypothetical protein cje145_03602 [Campylobacter jejuni subsp. jejuni 2008-1025]EIB54994.1 hypothetical protein cje154_0